MIIFETERLIDCHYEFEKDRINIFSINGVIDVMRYIRPVKPKKECEAFLIEEFEMHQLARAK